MASLSSGSMTSDLIFRFSIIGLIFVTKVSKSCGTFENISKSKTFEYVSILKPTDVILLLTRIVEFKTKKIS